MTAAPEAVRLPGAESAEAGERERRRLRVPGPVVVALLGIVLGSWLIPALTRQWDDRQKAGEVKASVIYDMATATARALMSAQEASLARHWERSSRPGVPAAARQWTVDSLRIQARLQTYFGPEALERWRLVSQYVITTLSLAYGDPLLPTPEPLAARRSPRLEAAMRQYWDDRVDNPAMTAAILAEQQTLTHDILAMHVRGYSTNWRDVVADLLPV